MRLGGLEGTRVGVALEVLARALYDADDIAALNAVVAHKAQVTRYSREFRQLLVLDVVVLDFQSAESR